MISIVIPAYNEAGNVSVLVHKLKEQFQEKDNCEIIFVDDGSMDSTLEEIKKVADGEKTVKFISFSRNFGHQKALKAGLDHAQGDCVISMDADMQHPPEMLCKLLEKWREGYDVVYTIRKDSEDTGFMKKVTSAFFYRLMNKISDVNIPLGAADFRLLDKKVVSELRKFNENWLFIRGAVSWLGFKQIGIEYIVQKRHAGKSKYSIARMIAFAVQGITSFSILPLRISMVIGFFFSCFSFLYAIHALYEKMFLHAAILGWTSILMSILFLGGVQLFFLGVIGEYLGKMFIETKKRPPYVIKEKRL
ncbi:MAG: glycosyltransferase family 2 protein [Thermodesulfovibrionales bacterium]|jgi:dolichol-phosphate mannosyltransferase